MIKLFEPRASAPFRVKPEMDGFEYQLFYDCGAMPERFWPREFEKLREEFARDELTLPQLEDALDDLLGISFRESMGHFP